METISIRTAQERHILALRTYRDIKHRQAIKSQTEVDLKAMRMKQATRKLRRVTQGTRY